MIYATFKYYTKKGKRLSIFGKQLEHGKIEITVLSPHPSLKRFKKSEAWKEYNTGQYPVIATIDGINQDNLVRWCNKQYYKENKFNLDSLTYDILFVDAKTIGGKISMSTLVKQK